ncbi:ABC transporter [Clostridiaceae bacterium 14S0207]|nr:ABC transporter [Clostridiaceae bacterium 14S0207]
MYFKIALNNVKKSFKDYTIYFLTLTFAVCIFYSFNSIGTQQAMLDMSKSQAKYIELMEKLTSYVSVFVSIILGGLIIYANNFLIKKRKKELGTYMVLGMGKNKIARILFLETFLIGIISLIVGLALGIILAQGLSIFTAKLFEVAMNEYKFLISIKAIGKTTLYFGIMFLLVMIFNTINISKYKLIDMLNASKKNEKLKLRNTVISSIVFIIGIATLVSAYYLINKSGLNPTDNRFFISIILGCLGTFLFFFGFAGTIFNIIQKNKSIYLKNLNIFITRQISSKINTNFISMTAICLMLFLTICTLSTGLSLKNALEQGLKNTTPFDAGIKIYGGQEPEEIIKKMGLKLNQSERYVSYKDYKIKYDIEKLMLKYADQDTKKSISMMAWHGIDAIKISDYNKIQELKGKHPVNLKDNEVLIASNFEPLKANVKKILQNTHTINIENKIYNIKNREAIMESFSNTGISNNFFTIIVEDKLLDGKESESSNININYVGDNKETSEKRIRNTFIKVRETKHDFDVTAYTRQQLYAESKGSTTLILYIIIYLGIIFLIASAAVLALQQLTDASDSVERYNALKKIGASKKMINKTIFIQTLIYFMIPLGLALVHSLVGIHQVTQFLGLYGSPNIGVTSIITVCLLCIVYGGYFYATYTGYKNIVK